MKSLAIHAGPAARRRLLEEGLHPDQFKVMVGASGGPKWFSLYGLDRYLFGEFLPARRDPLITLGSSAGAWRLCCLATADPVASVDRLARLYSEERYSEKPDTQEVTAQARTMLAAVLGASGAEEIVTNPRIITHIVCDRVKGAGASAFGSMQALWLGLSAAGNLLSRNSLSWFYQRVLFTNKCDLSPFGKLEDMDTMLVQLSADNVFDAMLASGSIPFVLDGVRDIAGAPAGLYWDGGITDYHFDLPFSADEGLVLYPHFYGRVIPGWFDKHVPWRRARAKHFDNVVILAPTDEFVASLPNGKLTDREDFRRYEFDERVQIFREVLRRSEALAEDFAVCVTRGIRDEDIHPIGNLRA